VGKRIFCIFIWLLCCNVDAEYQVDINEAIEMALVNNQNRVVSKEQLKDRRSAI